MSNHDELGFSLLTFTVAGTLIRFLSRGHYLPYPASFRQLPPKLAPARRDEVSTRPAGKPDAIRDFLSNSRRPPLRSTSQRRSHSTNATAVDSIPDGSLQRSDDLEALAIAQDDGGNAAWRNTKGAQRAIARRGEQGDASVVTWNGPDDPIIPTNWPRWYRWFCGGQVAFLTFMVTFASSVYTPGIKQIMEEFGVSEVVGTLGLTTFVAAYGLGPLIWSPLSEEPWLGRAPVYVGTLAIFCILQIPTALAPNIGSLLVLRFLGGVFASPALAVGGATLTDLFHAKERAFTMSVYGIMPQWGPVLGPIVGGYIVLNEPWRWTMWSLLWFGVFCLILLALFLPETSHDSLLFFKARSLRRHTGKSDLRALCERRDEKKGKAVKRVLLKPWQLLFLDPIVFLMSLYLGFLYALLYLFFSSYPYVFETLRGWNTGAAGLPFIGIFLGALLGFGIVAVYNRWYVRQYDLYTNQGSHPPPEYRLPPMMMTAPLIPISLLWFAWSAAPPTPWIVPVLGSVPFGTAYFCFFMSVLNYLADAFPPNLVASVMAANDLLRSIMGAALPLAATSLYSRLGPGKAGTILACISIALCPIPFMFWKHGASIRSRSRFAATTEGGQTKTGSERQMEKGSKQ